MIKLKGRSPVGMEEDSPVHPWNTYIRDPARSMRANVEPFTVVLCRFRQNIQTRGGVSLKGGLQPY